MGKNWSNFSSQTFTNWHHILKWYNQVTSDGLQYLVTSGGNFSSDIALVMGQRNSNL